MSLLVHKFSKLVTGCEILAKLGHVNRHRYHICQEANLLCKIKITSFKLTARPQHACVCVCVCGGGGGEGGDGETF